MTLNEFLDFDRTAEAQAEAAGRAVGALKTKTVKNGGFPFKIYSMLYMHFCYRLWFINLGILTNISG